MPSTFDSIGAGKITSGSRSWRLAVEVYARGVLWAWLELTLQGGHPFDGNLLQTQRLRSLPSINLQSERSTGVFSTQPVTLEMRNNDSLFDRSGSIVLRDYAGQPYVVERWRRARIRLRLIAEGNPAIASNYTLGQFYIDKITCSGDVAELKLQPLLRLLQLVSPEAVKEGDRWFRDVPGPRLIRRLLEHAIPTVGINAARFPKRISIPASRRAIESVGAGRASYTTVGPVIDSRGRMPDTVGNVEYPQRAGEIPTALCEDRENPALIYYATCDATGKARIYRSNRITNDSALIWTGNSGLPVVKLEDQYAGSFALTVTRCTLLRDDMAFGGMRRTYVARVSKASGATLATVIPGSYRWSFADQYVQLVEETVGAIWAVGANLPGDGKSFGEMIPIGFPQIFEAYLRNGTFDVVRNRYAEAKARNEIDPLVWPYGEEVRTDGIELLDRGGFQSSVVFEFQYPNWVNGGAVKYHHAPFPDPSLFIAREEWVVALEWSLSTVYAAGSWRLTRHSAETGANVGTITLQFPDSGHGNQHKQHQPVAWWAISQVGDASLGATNWVILATLDYRAQRLGDTPSTTKVQFWRIDLEVAGSVYDTSNGGLTLLAEHDPGPHGSSGPWPTPIGGCYQPALSPFDRPKIFGCYHDRKSNVYRVFSLDLGNGTLSLTISAAPVSGAPLVGWRAADDGVFGNGNQRIWFRDCGTGLLWEIQDGANYRILGQGRSVDPVGAWEAVPRLAFVADPDSPYDSRVLGFSAPSAPCYGRPMDANFIPPVELAGTFRLWELGPDVSLRIPVADFRPELVPDVQKVFDFLLQAAGSGWLYGIDGDDGYFYLEEITGAADQGFVDFLDREYIADWTQKEIPVFGLERADQTEDDVQNQVVIVPWEPSRPAVGGTLEFVPRVSGVTPDIAISATASTESGRRVTLNVVRDGSIGPNEVIGEDAPLEGYTTDWETTLLLSWSEEAEDVLTELAASAATYSTIRVRGMAGTDPFVRTIGGVHVRAAQGEFGGDWIQIGESGFGRVSSFSGADTITTSGCGSPPAGTAEIPMGTSVRIQPARTQARGSSIDDSDSGYLQLDEIPSVGTATVSVACFNADGVHAGNVVRRGQEIFYVQKKESIQSADPPFTHVLRMERAYLESPQAVHPAGPAAVFLHPYTALPQPIGATGLTIAFSADPTQELSKRTLQTGDRIVLDYEGVKAERAKFDQSIAEDPESVRVNGKRSQKYDSNPYVSSLLAPHLARLRLADGKDGGETYKFLTAFAPELPTTKLFYLRSKKRLPDAPDHMVTVRIRGISHDLADGVTHVTVVTLPSTDDPGAGGGVGAGVGTAVGGL